MNIQSFTITKMQKAEFPQFAKDMLQIMVKHKVEDMNLQVVNNLLADTMPALEAMKVMESKHELTVPLKAKHTERCKNAQIIVGLLAVYLRDDDRLAHAKKVESCIQLHLARIKRMNVVKVSQNFDLFFAKIDADSGLAEAFEALGLNGYVQKAKAANSEYRALNNKRRIDINKKAEKLTAQAHAKVSKNVKAAQQIINSAVIMYPDVDYNALIAELNALIAQYKVKLKARRTRNANKLLNATTAASSSKTIAAAE